MISFILHRRCPAISLPLSLSLSVGSLLFFSFLFLFSPCVSRLASSPLRLKRISSSSPGPAKRPLLFPHSTHAREHNRLPPPPLLGRLVSYHTLYYTYNLRGSSSTKKKTFFFFFFAFLFHSKETLCVRHSLHYTTSSTHFCYSVFTFDLTRVKMRSAIDTTLMLYTV